MICDYLRRPCETPCTCIAEGACRALAPIPAATGRITTDSAARKAVPLWSGLFGYFPDALAEVARLSFEANEKHNPGQPMHWSREKSNDHADCLMRHQLDHGAMDDDGFLHDVKVAWRALAQLQLAIEARRVARVRCP